MNQKLLPIVITILFLVAFCPPQIFAQGKFSGYMFGDYYYILTHNNSDLKAQNGFWFRRIYFTYDYKITDEWSTRFRLELHSPGDFKTKDSIKPFVKDAYLQWKKKTQNIILGISPTPTWEYIEGFWGYRSVEKTPLDLYKMGDSRDFGIAFRGSLGKKELFSYHIMFANGEGVKSEVNKEKKFMGSFLFKPLKRLSFELYGDFAQGASHRNYWTYQGFLGWKGERARVGIQYAHQIRQQGEGKEDLKIDVLSIIGAIDASEKVALFFRYDRMDDSLPAGPTISYVPMNGTAPFHMVMGGLDFHPLKNVKFIPNIMIVNYDEAKGTKPENDIYIKLTFFFSF